MSIKTVLKNNNSKFENLIYTSVGYSSCINDEIFKQNLLIKDDFFIDSIFNSLNIRELNDIFLAIESSFKHDGMNPNKREYPPNKYYYKSTILEELQSKLNFLIFNDNSKLLIQIGSKGSGKTITQNIILFNNHKLFEENNTTWVRCDVFKLYKLILQKTNFSFENYSVLYDKYSNIVEEYFKLQFLYVFCKYKHIENSFYNKIYVQLIKSEIKYRRVQNVNDPNNFIEKLIYEQIDIYANDIATTERESNYSYMLNRILNDSLDGSKYKVKRSWIELSDELLKYFKSNHYKIIFILDGLDNIDLLIKKNKNIYDFLLSRSHSFYSRFIDKLFIKQWISLRPRTFIEFNNFREQRDVNEFISMGQVERVNHELHFESNRLPEILNKRLQLTLYNENIFHSSKYFIIIINIFKTIYENDSKNENITNEFHFNCRNYLYNRLNLAKYLIFRIIQTNRFNILNLTDFVKTYEKRSRFFNNRIVINSNVYYDINKGDYCFNLFNYKSNVDLNELKYSQWYGLINIRILQFLLYNESQLTSLEYLKKTLIKYFRYPEELIVSSLDNLKEFGLVDSILVENSNELIQLEISYKGKFVFKLLFEHFDILYLCALDTPIPKEFIKSSKYISYFSNQINSNSNFEYECLKGGTLFIKFLICIDKYERNNFEKTIIEDGLDFANINMYQLPINLYYNKYLEYIDMVSKNLDPYQKQKLKNEIKELYY